MTTIIEPERRVTVSDAPDGTTLRIGALFAGTGGIEAGLHGAEHETVVWCEADDGAIAVLRAQFDVGEELYDDVADMPAIPSDVDLVTAG
jgi:site-specific DNA-cytosine methylase